MKDLQLSISTLQIEIKILTVDGKRFTKAVFNQLQHTFPFKTKDIDTNEYEQEGEIVGFVFVEGFRWLIIKKDNCLYKAKCRVSRYFQDVKESELLCLIKKGFSTPVKDNDDNHRIIYKEVMHISDSMQLFIAI